MSKIKVFLAQSHGDFSPSPFKISADTPAPSQVSGGNYFKFFDIEAEKIFHVLLTSLPGGTVDALTSKLLAHKACSLITPYAKD